MNNQSEPEIEEKILNILRVCHQPVTIKEINEFVKSDTRYIRDRVNKLVEQNLLQKFEEDEKSFSVLLTPGEKSEVIVPVNHVKTVDDVFQFVGRINLFDLPKIAGIHPYKNNVTAGIQRARQGAWTKTLSKRLNTKKTVMLNNITIYVDKNKIKDFPNPKDVNELVIPYQDYVGDTEKPCWLIDGQQRMWAMLRLSITKAVDGELEIEDPFFSPVTILVGIFNSDQEKVSQLSRWFVAANQTKNLPPNLIHELEARLLNLGKEDDLANSNKAYDAQVLTWLDFRDESPFYNNIKSQSNDKGIISDSSIMSIISHMREKMRLNYGEKDNIEVYNFILDYYWVIRIIWNKYWIKPPKSSREFGSRLLTPLGLGGLAFLMEDIAPLEIRKLNRKDRIRELFKRFFRISDDIDWTEMKLNEYKNLRGDLLRFVSDILLPVYEAQIHEHVPDDELKDLLELLPEEFISTFEIEEGN